jgi:AcrR family transcriptional regulator
MDVKEEESDTPPRTRKAEQSEATRAALVGVARELFSERGYSGVGTEEIVRRAGVTRGALYHHFRGKDDLFLAVFHEVETELTERIAAIVLETAATDPLDAMRAGTGAFLEASREPAIQRITMIDAPAVLGWEEWRRHGERYGIGLVTATLQAAMDAGVLERQPVRPLAHILLAALEEAAMLVARSDDPEATQEEIGATLDRVLEGLRAR